MLDNVLASCAAYYGRRSLCHALDSDANQCTMAKKLLQLSHAEFSDTLLIVVPSSYPGSRFLVPLAGHRHQLLRVSRLSRPTCCRDSFRGRRQPVLLLCSLLLFNFLLPVLPGRGAFGPFTLVRSTHDVKATIDAFTRRKCQRGEAPYASKINVAQLIERIPTQIRLCWYRSQTISDISRFVLPAVTFRQPRHHLLLSPRAWSGYRIKSRRRCFKMLAWGSHVSSPWIAFRRLVAR